MTTRTRKPSPDAHAAQLTGHGGFSLITNQKLLQIYSTMVKCGRLEKQVRLLQKNKHLKMNKRTGNSKASLGHEAAAVAVAIDLLSEDIIAPAPLDFLLNFIKGAPLTSVFRETLAGTSGALPLAVQIETAGAAAMANKTKKNGKVVVAFLGDLPASPDFLEEALHFAGIHQLPILFVCRNGAASPPRSLKKKAQPEDLARRAQAHGVPFIPVDGDDAVALYRVATESIAHARRGNGPTLIECKIVDRLPHPKLASGRRKAGAPLKNMEEYLTRKGLFSEEIKRKAADEFDGEMEAAIAAARSYPGKPLNKLAL